MTVSTEDQGLDPSLDPVEYPEQCGVESGECEREWLHQALQKYGYRKASAFIEAPRTKNARKMDGKRAKDQKKGLKQLNVRARLEDHADLRLLAEKWRSDEDKVHVLIEMIVGVSVPAEMVDVIVAAINSIISGQPFGGNPGNAGRSAQSCKRDEYYRDVGEKVVNFPGPEGLYLRAQAGIKPYPES